MEEMKYKGYGGATIYNLGYNYDDSGVNRWKTFSPTNTVWSTDTKAGPVFLSPEWMELYKHAVKEAQRLGIELCVNLGSGFNPGGPSITPELALKKIVYTDIKIHGERKFR